VPAHASVTIENCSFHKNTAGFDGGSILLQGARVNLSNSLFSYNTARQGSGGAIMITSSPTAFISRVCCVGNEASKSGGAMYVNTTDTFSGRIHATLFTNNTAPEAGALHICTTGSVGSTFNVSESSFLQNVGSRDLIVNASDKLFVYDTSFDFLVNLTSQEDGFVQKLTLSGKYYLPEWYRQCPNLPPYKSFRDVFLEQDLGTIHIYSIWARYTSTAAKSLICNLLLAYCKAWT
jgi:predicted outer membrane repeat protein